VSGKDRKSVAKKVDSRIWAIALAVNVTIDVTGHTGPLMRNEMKLWKM
jgi:hypothetical protein